MERHMYSLETINEISNGIAAMRTYLENATLSTESMPYSWNTGIINTVVQWIEVNQVNQLKNSLIDFLSESERNFIITKSGVARLDQVTGKSIDDYSSPISEGIAVIDTLSSFLNETVPVPTIQ